MANTIPIQEVSKRVQLSSQTIRRWSAEGKLSFVPARAKNGTRIYTEEQVQELIQYRDHLHNHRRGKK